MAVQPAPELLRGAAVVVGGGVVRSECGVRRVVCRAGGECGVLGNSDGAGGGEDGEGGVEGGGV